MFGKFLSCITLIALLLGCQSDRPNLEDDTRGLQDVKINGLRYHYDGNGNIEILDDRSWIFTSHTNTDCYKETSSRCRKIDINYTDYTFDPSRITNHSFDFQLIEINEAQPPESVIIFQDWVRIYDDDTDGNRPISTIKMEKSQGKFYLRHYDNSWQWNSPPIQGNPSTLPENRLNGEYPIDIGVTYHVDFYLHDSGYASLVIDDQKVSDVFYQTKRPDGAHTIQWGLYWTKGYNKELDPLKRIIISIENFTLPESDK